MKENLSPVIESNKVITKGFVKSTCNNKIKCLDIFPKKLQGIMVVYLCTMCEFLRWKSLVLSTWILLILMQKALIYKQSGLDLHDHCPDSVVILKVLEYFRHRWKIQYETLRSQCLHVLPYFCGYGLFPFQNNQKNLDLSSKTELSLWACFWGEKPS